MAILYPFSNETVRFLSEPPEAGETHIWLAQAAGRLKQHFPADKCAAYLRSCCNECVQHRAIPDKEITDAVQFAYSEHRVTLNTGISALKWPAAQDEVIGKVIAGGDPLFDGETSTGLRPEDVLVKLFEPGELVCSGFTSDRALVRPLEEALSDAHLQQFIVVNPMKGKLAMNHEGNPSVRCQNNVAGRRHLVAEFDDASIPKSGQAVLASALGELAPLVMVVDSGGKSLHCWFRVDGMEARDQATFFAHACMLGADRTRWDVCGWLRMPGGMRHVDGVPKIRQKILYWKER